MGVPLDSFPARFTEGKIWPLVPSCTDVLQRAMLHERCLGLFHLSRHINSSETGLRRLVIAWRALSIARSMP